MIKKFLILFVIFSLQYILPQEQQKQESTVELPDFVITGEDIVNIKKAEKIPADFVSTISETFLKPTFPTENLKMKDIVTPIIGTSTLIDSLNYLTGNFDAGVGSYSLPKMELNVASPFSNGLFEGYANAENMRAYVPNSDRYSINGGANLSLFTSDGSDFLPGAEYKFHGNFGNSAYKFFGSDVPTFKRTLNNGNASFELNNLMSSFFIFTAKFSDDIYNLKSEKFSENIFKIGGIMQYSLQAFNLGVDYEFKRQYLTDDILTNGKFNFVSIKPSFGFSITSQLNMNIGFNYEHSGSNKFFSPSASAAMKFNNGFSLYAELSPQAEFWGGGHFLQSNEYFMPEHFTNIFFEKKAALSAAIKYEYFTYVEIDAGIKYFRSDNLPYFSDTSNSGMFDLQTTGAKSFSTFVNLLFHPGPGGMFYATGELNDIKSTSGSIIPYYPRIKATLNYEYNINHSLNAGADITFLSGMHENILIKSSLNPDADLGLKFGYRIFSNFYLTFNLSNLLNRNNYLWQGYKEAPLSLFASINYSW